LVGTSLFLLFLQGGTWSLKKKILQQPLEK
jgi:hypothetical protein